MIIIAIIVIIIVVVVIIVVTSTTTTLPQTLIITMNGSSTGTPDYPTYVPANGVYTLTSETSLGSYNSILSTALPVGFTVTQVYKLTGDYQGLSSNTSADVVFIRYMESGGISRYALIFIKGGAVAVSTVNDITTLTDPTTYTGKWSTYNATNLTTSSGQVLFIN